MSIPMKWSNTGASLIGGQVRDGATVRQIDEPRPRRAEHFHVHVHDAPAAAKPSARSHDAVAPRPVVRRGDQQEPAPGSLICKIARNGETGDWRGVDGDGNELQVGDDGTGWLAVRHAGGEDPDTSAMKSAPGRDAGPAGLRGYARMLAEHYKRRG
jgi:hypothetical protein